MAMLRLREDFAKNSLHYNDVQVQQPGAPSEGRGFMRSVRSQVGQTLAVGRRALARALYLPSRVRLAMRRNVPRKLQVGSGGNRMPGWINSDIEPWSEVIVFLEKRLPFGDGSLERIYLEHVLEHVSYETALHFLKEARRVLQPGGVVRIAVPDLEELASAYLDDNWRHLDWVRKPEFAFVRTRAQMINISFRWWGHMHLYDKEEMERALHEAGFTTCEFVARGESSHFDLRGLETRPESNLVVEATKH